MKSINKLFNKAVFFEKLATYGNRKAMLKSLAQSGPGGLTQSINKLRSIVDSMSGSESYLLYEAALRSLDMGESPASAIKAAESLKTVILNDSQLDDLSYSDSDMGRIDLLRKIDGVLADLSLLTPVPSNYEKTKFTAPVKPKPSPSFIAGYKFISPHLQSKLRDFALEKGLFTDNTSRFYNPNLAKRFLAMTADGKLGPETRAIIEVVKKYLNDNADMPITKLNPGSESDSALFSLLENTDILQKELLKDSDEEDMEESSPTSKDTYRPLSRQEIITLKP